MTERDSLHKTELETLKEAYDLVDIIVDRNTKSEELVDIWSKIHELL